MLEIPEVHNLYVQLFADVISHPASLSGILRPSLHSIAANHKHTHTHTNTCSITLTKFPTSNFFLSFLNINRKLISSTNYWKCKQWIESNSLHLQLIVIIFIQQPLPTEIMQEYSVSGDNVSIKMKRNVYKSIEHGTKCPPRFFCSFVSNCLEFQNEMLSIYLVMLCTHNSLISM